MWVTANPDGMQYGCVLQSKKVEKSNLMQMKRNASINDSEYTEVH